MDAFLEFWLWQPSTAAAGFLFVFIGWLPCGAIGWLSSWMLF
ncbi:MAG: hypothetical protein SO144_02800 [Campylobacter sp.]|nr:hypothetical protein [Campylobacter sp.]